MSTYYVDPAASGANDGTSWTDAWTTLQSAADNASAGDIVYCRGTETLAAPIDFDTNSGNLNPGYIKFIGCNGSGTVDGTFFVLDGNSAAANCIRGVTTAQTYLWFENMEFKNATGNGVESIAGCDYWGFVNCIAHNNGAHGFDCDYLDYCIFFGCRAYSNTNTGFYASAYTPDQAWICCVAYDNSDSGFEANQINVWFLCVSHDNGPDAGDRGFYSIQGRSRMFSCVADGEVEGFSCGSNHNRMFFNRFTNNTEAIDFNNKLVHAGFNYLHGNSTDLANPASWSSSGAYASYVAWKSTTNSNKADTDADDGYNNRTNDDFNLKASRTYNGDGNDVIDLGIGS